MEKKAALLASVTLTKDWEREKIKIEEKLTIMEWNGMEWTGQFFDRTWCCIFLLDEQAKNIHFFSIGKEKKRNRKRKKERKEFRKSQLKRKKKTEVSCGRPRLMECEKKSLFISKFLIFIISFNFLTNLFLFKQMQNDF